MEESLTRQKICALESLESFIKDDIRSRLGLKFTYNILKSWNKFSCKKGKRSQKRVEMSSPGSSFVNTHLRSCNLVDGDAQESSTESAEINRINDTVARLRQSISTLDLISEPAAVACANGGYKKPILASPFTNSELSLESITSDLGGSISAKSPSHLKYQFLVDSGTPPTLSPLSVRASTEDKNSQEEEAIINFLSSMTIRSLRKTGNKIIFIFRRRRSFKLMETCSKCGKNMKG